MAAVTYSAITDYVTRPAGRINTPWAAIATQSVQLNAENFRDEGLDTRNASAGLATDGYDITSYAGADVAALAYNVFTDITLGATLMRCTNSGAGWAVGAGVGQLRVQWSCRCVAAYAAALDYSSIMRFRIRYNTNLGTTNVTGTETEHQGYGTVATNVTATPSVFRDDCAFEYLIPLTGGVTIVNWVQAQAMIDVGTMTIGKAALIVDRFLKVA